MNFYTIADQKIPEKQKDKEWHKQHIYSYALLDAKRSKSERLVQQMKCWKAYTCYHDSEHEKNSKPITSPYGLSLGMEWIVYPLVESKLEQMVGEFMTRGIKRKTYVINKRAITKKLNEMYDMIAEEILREVNQELEPALGFTPETPNPEKELPANLEEFFETGFKTSSEKVSDIILNQVLIGKKEISKVSELYLDFLLYDECLAYITERDGNPSIKKLNIFTDEIDIDPENEIQNNPQYLIFNRILSYNEIINNFQLNDDEIVQLQSYQNTIYRNPINDETDTLIKDGYDCPGGSGYWFTNDDSNLRIRCVEMVWISQKKVSVKVSINSKTGKEIYKRVPDDYKKRKGDNVESIWVEQKRKCVMVGPDIVLEYGEDNERASRIDDPKKDSIFVVGLRRNNSINGNQIRSAASKLIQLQEFASECLFELRLAMRRNNGRVLVYDAAQIPKQFLKSGGYGNAINRVMHHAKKDQFLIINSMDKQSRYAFNQFTSLDMSTKGLMQDLFNVLALIEDLASKFIGLPPQRTGEVGQYESATGTERAVTQSTARTEVYVKPFENFLKFLFDKILIKGKYVYEENEICQYLFGDNLTKFFKVYPDYFQEDVGVYIADNFNEQRKKATIDAAAQQTLSNANTPELILSLIETLNADTAGESEAIFKQAVKSLNILKEQEQKFQAEQADKQAEATRYAADKASEDKAKQMQNNKEVAYINVNGQEIRERMKNSTNAAQTLAEIEANLMAKETESKPSL